MLGVCAQTIRTMCDDGRLECIKPAGTQRRISKATVDAYLTKLGCKPALTPARLLAPPGHQAPYPPEAMAEIRKKIRRLRTEQRG